MKNLFLLLWCFVMFSCTKEKYTAQTLAGNKNPVLKTNTVEQLEGEFLLNQSANPAFHSRAWQGIPSITASHDGILYAVWYSGGPTEGVGNYITLSVSTDGGTTWNKDKLIINPVQGANVRFFDPALWTDKFGNVMLSWAKSKCIYGTPGSLIWDGVGGVWACQINYVSGNITYTPATRYADGVMMCRPSDRINQLGTMYPIAVWGVPAPFVNPPVPNKIYIYGSVYSTSTPTSGSATLMSEITPDANTQTYPEHQIIELNNYGYLVMIRGNDGLYYTRRTYSAGSWDPIQKITATQFPSSKFFLGRLQSGKIALVANNSTNPARSHLTIFLSSDEMQTWSYSKVLDSRDNVSYPDLVQSADGKIHVVYDRERYGAKEINYISFTEADVMSPTTVSIHTISSDIDN